MEKTKSKVADCKPKALRHATGREVGGTQDRGGEGSAAPTPGGKGRPRSRGGSESLWPR